MSDSITTEWSDLPLDSRILEALKDLKWAAPTTVQGACVPLAIKGKDLSIQSRTGSGKTGAFVIPIIQRIITERERKAATNSNPVALILVPSVELCEQTVEAAQELSKYVKPRLVVDNLTRNGAITAARVKAAHIVVATAAHLAKACRTGTVSAETLQNLRYLVIDEADMLVTMAETSMRTVQAVLPSSMQVILASATLNEGVATMKGQLLRNPVNIVLTDEEDDGPAVDAGGPVVESRVTLKDPLKKTLKQYYLVSTDECHRHTLLFALYRMNLISGKTLIFVEDDEDTYKLQNFLEQLGVATLVYDASLPMNVRFDALRRFQSGAVSTLVCTDGTLESVEQLQMMLSNEEGGSSDAPGGASQQTAGRRKRRRGDGDDSAPSALHRGIDFADVRNVILFDGVDSQSSIALSRYTHRIGRAGRAGREGLSLTFFTLPQAKKYIHPLRNYVRSKGDEVRPFKQMQRSESTKLQYRVDSVLGNITRSSTRKLRVATVAAELSRSSYLSNHMNQKDSEALQRVVRRSEKKVRIERDLLELPDYMKIKKADDVADYTKRVRAGQTRANKFRDVTRPASSDPLKAVASRLRSARKKE